MPVSAWITFAFATIVLVGGLALAVATAIRKSRRNEGEK